LHRLDSLVTQKEADDLAGWSELQGVDEIDVGRYFEYDADAIQRLGTWLDFIRNSAANVLEVGAGTGFFTRILLKLNPRMTLTCLEPDDTFVKVLEQRFGRRTRVVQGTIEESSIQSESFHAVVSHIVLHNLPDALRALCVMKEAVRKGGHVVAIEPAPGFMNHYPSDDIARSFRLLGEVKTLRWRKRKEVHRLPEDWQPYSRCYPQIFEKAGLRRIRCYGLSCVFTLSDERYSFAERKKWIRMRRKLLEDERTRTTRELMELGTSEQDIDRAYSVVFDYVGQLERASEEELSHIHEQEVTNRTVTIGQKH